MKNTLAFLLSFLLAIAARGAATVEAVTINSPSGLVLNSTATNFPTGKLKLNGATLEATFQPLDSDLTSIAALTTNSAGRSLLTLSSVPTGALVGTTDTQALTGKTINGLTISTTTGTLSIANGKTLTASNSLTFAGTDGATLSIGGGGTLGSNAYTSTAYAPLASPALTGAPTAPTAAGGTNTTQVATTAFVQAFTGSTNLVTLGKGAITGLTEDTTPSAANDFVMTYDASADGLKKVKLTNLGAGGGGGSIALPLSAWLEPTGNDTTGTVGDPSKPYLTAQAAFDDGARVFYLGADDYSLNVSGAAAAVQIAVAGKGGDRSSMYIEGTTYALTVDGMGGWRCTGIGMTPAATGASAGAVTIRNVWVDGGIASDGRDGSDGGGQAGGNGGTVVAYNCRIVSIENIGGNGGTHTTGAGGSGGNGGAVILSHCIVGTITSYGGNGGASIDGVGGNGGNGSGTFTLDFTSASGDVTINGGNGGTSTNSIPGNGGAGGQLGGTHYSLLTTLYGAGGTGDINGGDAGIMGSFVYITVIGSGTPYITASGYYINGAGSW